MCSDFIESFFPIIRVKNEDFFVNCNGYSLVYIDIADGITNTWQFDTCIPEEDMIRYTSNIWSKDRSKEKILADMKPIDSINLENHAIDILLDHVNRYGTNDTEADTDNKELAFFNGYRRYAYHDVWKTQMKDLISDIEGAILNMTQNQEWNEKFKPIGSKPNVVIFTNQCIATYITHEGLTRLDYRYDVSVCPTNNLKIGDRVYISFNMKNHVEQYEINTLNFGHLILAEPLITKGDINNSEIEYKEEIEEVIKDEGMEVTMSDLEVTHYTPRYRFFLNPTMLTVLEVTDIDTSNGLFHTTYKTEM